jgi:hypothetical protein
VGEARRSLKFGEWTTLCRSDEVAFGIRQGQNLVRIDKKLGDLNAQVSARLPWAWSTLYQLSLLPRSVLLDLVESKKINRRLTEAGAKRLVGQIRGQQQLGKTSIKRRLKAIHEWIEQNLADWAGDERDQVTSAFAEFIRRIRLGDGAQVSSPAASQNLDVTVQNFEHATSFHIAAGGDTRAPQQATTARVPLDFDNGSDSSGTSGRSTLLRVGTPALRSPDCGQVRIQRSPLETSSPEPKSL